MYDKQTAHASLQTSYDDVVKEVAQCLTAKATALMQLGLPRYVRAFAKHSSASMFEETHATHVFTTPWDLSCNVAGGV